MRLDNFDLNLLVAFDVLLQELNVTRAAERMNVTQSAMSASLKRLREGFQDEILTQHGKRMIPTPFAMALHPEIATTISELRSLIARKGSFQPERSDRRFRIAASDYITTVLLTPLLQDLATLAPSVSFEFTLPGPASQARLANGELDLLLTPQTFAHPDHPLQTIFTEDHVVVACARNPLANGALDAAAFVSAGHVGVSISGRYTFAEDWFQMNGVERRIEVHVPSFVQAPFMVPGTQRLCVMHERLARFMAARLDLVTFAIPFPIPPMTEIMQFHATRKEDPGLSWLRTHIARMAAEDTLVRSGEGR
ncbi:LysR family transcriptional regulator [Erythrobacter arachoides]|uniref:LysR family transcriptional regulator n=1 Tax=Aurantiacibacter arachoides TaxID=1850444 RepID=A0A845A2C3_9SPHN|nr:LysR family transcriptional regulator [Aurantiacibacter arachoides]MXO93844.1 LysR family transcriptional regulator [Aurantiacibacter arachoides]GGD46284.1 nodulation protein D 1 [Aurantiacibacter arachoides]